MAGNQDNLFSRLTKLFRSGPVVRRKIGVTAQGPVTHNAQGLFKRNVSDMYSSTVSAYGSFDRMCVDLNTKIPVPGPEKYLTMQELIDRYPNGERFVVYAYDATQGKIVPAFAHHPRSSGIRETVKITFDSGEYLICTPDHPCLMRNGEFVDAGDLKPGDSMMPFYRKNFNNSSYYNVFTMDKDGWNGWQSEHKIIAEWVAGRSVEKNKEHVHHIDHDPGNNNPDNLVIMDAQEHLSMYARLAKHHKTPEYRQKMSDIEKAAWIQNDEDEDGLWRKNLIEFNKKQETREKRRSHALNNNPSKNPSVARKISQKQTTRYSNPEERLFASQRTKRLHQEGKLKVSESFSKYWLGKNRSKEFIENRSGQNHTGWIDIQLSSLIDAIIEFEQRKLVAKKLGCSPSTIGRRAQALLGGSSWKENIRLAYIAKNENHKVVSVEPWETLETGDLTVDGYENFATDTIIVHNSRYSDFAEMEATPEISSALDIYAEESSSQDERGRVLHIHSENRHIKELLENLFYDILNVDFNLPMWTRNLTKYGDFFLYLDVSQEYGVVNTYPIPIAEIEREEGFDPNDPSAVRFRWITKGNTILENWQVIHFRLLGNDAFLPYGSSVLESARRIWRQLILIEDAMLVYRIVRAPERRIFYIDVGNIPPDEIENYMEQNKSALKRNMVVDRTNGKGDLRYNPMSVNDDYFLPVRGGDTGTRIETLAGGQNTAAVEDVEYIQKKLFAALNVPKAYLGYDESIGSKATLAQEDIRFSRKVARIQKVIISELNKVAMIHLYSHGFTDEDIMDFTLSLNNPSSVAQLQKLELIKTKFDIAGSAPEGSVDRSWIRRNIFGFSSEEIELIKEGRKADKLEDEEIEKVSLDGDADSEGDDSGSGDDMGDMDDLFASDTKDGDIIGEFDGESDLPISASSEANNVFGSRKKRKRRRFSNAKAEIPDFLTMANDSRPQSTSNEPFGDIFDTNMDSIHEDISTSLKDSMFGDTLNMTIKPRKTPEFNSMIKNYESNIVNDTVSSVLLEDMELDSDIEE